jgi:hypothetical protein
MFLRYEYTTTGRYFCTMDKQLQALDNPVLWIHLYRLVYLGYAATHTHTSRHSCVMNTPVQVGIPGLCSNTHTHVQVDIPVLWRHLYKLAYLGYAATNTHIQVDIPVLWIHLHRLVYLGYAATHAHIQVDIPVLWIHLYRLAYLGYAATHTHTHTHTHTGRHSCVMNTPPQVGILGLCSNTHTHIQVDIPVLWIHLYRLVYLGYAATHTYR